MRWIALLFTLVAFAGCVSDDPAPEENLPVTQNEPETEPFSYDGMQEFCGNNTSFACDFDDGLYHEYVVYDLDTTVIDVLIVPPAGVSTPDNIAASRLAVQQWSDGIEALGEPWFTEAFELNTYAVGEDVPSIDAVSDPEIIVISTSAEFLIGIGLEPKQIGCILLGETALQDYGGHFHGENYVMAQDCTGIGFTCFALNVGAPDPRGLYDLIAHEVGHCLGAGHVGDAGDFKSRYAPVEDIMSYQDNPEKVHCVSNLNARVLEGVYAHLIEPEGNHTFLPRGSYLPMHPAEYYQHECDNPPGM
ncbi:MAG: hypothetical protein ACPHK8_01635 [Thermoplasmatota archaeon]